MFLYDTDDKDADFYPYQECGKIHRSAWGLKVHTRKHHPNHYHRAPIDTYGLNQEAQNKPEVKGEKVRIQLVAQNKSEVESEKMTIPTTQAIKNRYNCITCDKQLGSLSEFQHHIKEMHPRHSLSKIKSMENSPGENDKVFNAMDENVKGPNNTQKSVSNHAGQINKELVVVEKKAKDAKHKEYTIRVPVGADISTIKTALKEAQIIPWKCYSTSCNARFPTKSQLLEHYRTHCNHFCNTCRSIFHTKSELDNHLKMSHRQYCDICCQSFQSAKEFLNHICRRRITNQK